MPNGKRTAALIWNPAAGRAEEELALVRETLEQHFTLTVYETCQARDADICAREAVAAQPDVVIAAGGDGTVSLVASALVGTQTPLAVLPRGTANSIAAGLGISDDLMEAAQTLAEGEARWVDTARANGRTMVLHASVGLHAATIVNTPREAKNRWGVLAYLAEGLSALRDLEPFQVEMETESEVVRCRATNVTIANVAPLKTLLAQGPALVSPDDGQLDVTIVTATGIAEAVATGFHLLRTAAQGEPATRDNIGFLAARRVRIVSDPPQPLLIDGERAGEGVLTVQIHPHSLRVIVPAAPPAPPPEAPPDDKLEGLPGLEIELK